MAVQRTQFAKLTRPRMHQAVARQRLFTQLDQVREHRPAVCVVGPPGAGKTTLVASWLDARAIKSIWYQVDAGDVDLATFFYYLGEAVKAFSRKGERALPALTPEYLHDVLGFSRRFFRGLFSRLPPGATLVLDNYQEVEAHHEFHQIIAEAVNEIPPGITFIAVSRRDPPDAYARLIANEHVAFIEWEELKLTLQEARTIATLKGFEDLDWVRLIHTRTDGWAAGLILMLERGDVADADSKIHFNTHQVVFDYFADQIFSRVGKEVRQFLIETAWLPSISVNVAEALTGNHAAKEILEDLHRRHLFVHRRAGSPPSYQYHALFRDFLQSDAQATIETDALNALKLAAARQLVLSGDTEGAIELLWQSAAWDEYIRLIVLRAPEVLYQGRWRTLQEWVARLPVAFLKRTPWIGYWLGVSKLSMAPSAARELFERAFELFREGGDVVGQILCLTGVMQSHWAEYSGFDELERCLDRVLPLLNADPRFPDAETELRVLSNVLTAMLLRQPRNPMISPALRRIQALISSSVTVDAKLLAASTLMAYCSQSGHLEIGDWLVAAVDTMAQGASVSPIARLMWMGRIPFYFAFRGEHQKAKEALRRVDAVLKEEGVSIGRPFFHYYGAFTSVLAGDLSAGKYHVTKLEEIAAGLDQSFNRDLADWLRCVIELAEGKAKEAADHGRKAFEGAKNRNVAWARAWFGVAFLHGLLDCAEYDAAESCIREVREFVAGTFLERYEVELLLAQAYLAFIRDHKERFRDLLRQAWTLAKKYNFIFGYRSTFRVHRFLFSETLKEGIESDYVRKVIRRFGLRPFDTAQENWPWPVRIYTLGRFQVLVGDEPLSFGRKTPRKPLALLKALIGFQGQAVPEQSIWDAIWPDQEGDAAGVSCKVAVHRLRKLLGGVDTIAVEGGRLSLDLQQVWVDALAFEHAAAGFTQVGKLYGGAFLPEESGPWALAARQRLRSRFIRYVLDEGRRLAQGGDLTAAANLYELGIEKEELTEEFYEGLMRCHIARGRHADALATYRHLRQTLSVTLGTTPSREIDTLLRSVEQR